MATLRTEESGHCGEVETRVNVWLSAQKIAIVERWPISGLVQLYLNYNKAWTFSFLFWKTEAKRHCSAAIYFLVIQSFNFTSLVISFVPCEQWLLLAGCYATKGEKPLPATVCFSIKQACPHNAYIKMSNDIDHLSFSSFARNISKTTTSQMHHTFLYTSLLFLHDYHIKIPYFMVYGERKYKATTDFFSLSEPGYVP